LGTIARSRTICAACPAEIEKGRAVKVVLFCGGLGMRARGGGEEIPKPLIPIGGQPILWHIMNFYSRYGYRDFLLCLGYKSQMIKDFFAGYRPYTFADCVVTNAGLNVELLHAPHDEWNVTLLESGIWSNIGERLLTARDYLGTTDLILANYGDCLADVDLSRMITYFKGSRKVACFLAIRPPLSYHVADIGTGDEVRRIRSAKDENIWINGGFFLLRPEVYDYMRPGEDLLQQPFRRLIEADQLIAYQHEGFWRALDTLKDQQMLEDLVEEGRMPWLPDRENMEPRQLRIDQVSMTPN
jgi:glucose-1-phosphate cytidylyltransferase